MNALFINELEAAATVFMGAPGITSVEERRNAERVILNFRKITSPYQLCKEILETSQLDILRYEAADVIKNAIDLEWDTLEDQFKLSLRQYLLNYILKENLQHFIREKILRVVAIMIKRSSLLDAGSERGLILNEAQNMLSTCNLSQQYLACRIVLNIMEQYLATNRDDTRLTILEHYAVKKQFEILHSRTIFTLFFEALIDIAKIIDLNNPMHVQLLLEYFTILEQICLWTFTPPAGPKETFVKLAKVARMERTLSFRLGFPWAQTILEPRVLEVFFGIYSKVRDIPQIQQKALTCIIQLSTLNGPVLRGYENKLTYVTNFVTQFLQLISSIQVRSTEAIGMATIFRQILMQHLTYFDKIAEELRCLFLEHMYVLMGNFTECSTREDRSSSEDSVYTEALDCILEAWLILLQWEDVWLKNKMESYFVPIFNKYLQCHLSPVRSAVSQSQSNCNVDESEERDRNRYREQLIIIGAFGRGNTLNSLKILCELFENKTQCLQDQLERIYNNSTNLNISSTEGMEPLYEDILWIILISAHVMTQEAEGEQAMIPLPILNYSISQEQNGEANLTESLKLLTLEVQTAESTCDYVLRLTAAVFRLCQVESTAMKANMKSFLSPEITSNLMWFLQMWAESYLLYPSDCYKNIPVGDTIKTAFGTDSATTSWIVEFILHKISVNVRYFHTEPHVAEDSLQLFLSLVKDRHKCASILASDCFLDVLEVKHMNIPKQTLFNGLVLLANWINSPHKEQFLTETLSPINDKYKMLNPMNDYSNQIDVNTTSIQTVANLDEIRACFKGTSIGVARDVFTFFEDTLSTIPQLLQRYQNCHTVARAVLELFCAVMDLSVYTKYDRTLEISAEVVNAYVYNRNNRVSIETTAEDETFEDVMLLLNLLTSLLSNLICDLELERQIRINNLVLRIFTQIMALVKFDLLQHPSICTSYFKAAEMFIGAKFCLICYIPIEILSDILANTEKGLYLFGAEVQMFCLEYVQTLSAVRNEESQLVYATNLKYIGTLFELILNQTISSDNQLQCGRTLFSLLCTYKDFFLPTLQQIVSSRTNINHAERLSEEISKLMRDIEFSVTKNNTNMFLERFDKFLVNIAFLYDGMY